MAKRVRSVIYCAALLCAVMIAGWIVLGSRGAGLQEQRLPDGSSFILRRVTYGYTHRLRVGNFWQRLVGGVLPVKYGSRWFPSLVYDDTNGGPTLVVWIEHVSGNKYGGNAHLTDESGTDFSEGSYFNGISGNHYMDGYVFHALPGTSRELHFQLFYKNPAAGGQQSCRFTFPNPAFHPEAQKPTA